LGSAKKSTLKKVLVDLYLDNEWGWYSYEELAQLCLSEVKHALHFGNSGVLAREVSSYVQPLKLDKRKREGRTEVYI